jgi:hypothetical protein
VNVDEDGSIWNSNPAWRPQPKEGTDAYRRAMAIDIAFDKWMRDDACPHDDMNLASERIANWSGVGGFQQALAQAGEARFATVLSALPRGNGGSMPPATAARMLEELDTFLALEGYGSLAVLVDEASGEVLGSAATSILIQASGKEPLQWRLDERGFVLLGCIHGVRDVEVFRAMHFAQWPAGDWVEYRNLDTGAAFQTRMGIGSPIQPVPRQFRVEFRQQDPADYADVVEALRTVCRASLQSGNHVVWM